jgi:putative ABC transport system permease protein
VDVEAGVRPGENALGPFRAQQRLADKHRPPWRSAGKNRTPARNDSHTPSGTCRNDGKAPGKGPSAPDVEETLGSSHEDLIDPKSTNRLAIKIRGEGIPATLAFIEKTWKRFSPEYPFEFTFFDEIFDQAYRVEQRLGTVFSAFASLAVLIACLGLLGLASFTVEQKTKEIGIRKVLGASPSGVVVMLSREFMKWVVAANIVAWPVGYLAMRSWLRNFAYRTSLTVPMFLGAAMAAFLIAAAVISVQTYRAATADPVRSMRYE